MRNYYYIAGLFTIIVAISCNTYIFQPVKKQLEGKWELSPQDSTRPDAERYWIFDGDKLMVILQNGDTVKYCSEDVVSNKINYNVENKTTKHYLITERYWDVTSDTIGDPCIVNKDIKEFQRKWLIVDVNKTTLYLSSEERAEAGHKIKGGWQKGFVKVD